MKNIVKYLSEKLRPYDTLGRYGGDEFMVYFPNTTAAEAYEVAERLRIHIENSSMICEKEHVSVTISIGIGLACHSIDLEDDSNGLIM